MDICPMCKYVDPSTKNNPVQTAHMNKYVVDSLEGEAAERSAKILNSNERYVTLNGILHRNAKLPKGAPKEASTKPIPASNAPTQQPPAPASPNPVINDPVVANSQVNVPETKYVQTFVK